MHRRRTGGPPGRGAFIRCGKKYIDDCANAQGLTPAVYLRELAMAGNEKRLRNLPPPVLVFNGQLAQIIGVLEIIARQRLDGDDLLPETHAELAGVAAALKQIIQEIKTYLQ